MLVRHSIITEEFNCVVVTLRVAGVAMTHFSSFPSFTVHTGGGTKTDNHSPTRGGSMTNCSVDPAADCFDRRKMLNCSSDSDCYEPTNVCLIPLFSEAGTCTTPNKIPFPNPQVSCD